MKLIIDIPEDNIRVEYGEVRAIRSDKDILCNYIFHGTPLTESDDCVSRKAVLDLFGGCVEEEYPKISYVVKMCINDLPSVQPKRDKEDKE